MAGRKPKGFKLTEKLKTYLETYELDDLNKANDLDSLKQLAQFEIIIENFQNELASMKTIGDDTKKAKDLSAALRDTENSYTSLQQSLGIDRRKRQSDSEESVLSYIDKIKAQSKKMWKDRLEILKCEKCHLPLMKYYIYVKEKGEKGSIMSEIVPVIPIKYNLGVECPRCGDVISTNEGESSS